MAIKKISELTEVAQATTDDKIIINTPDGEGGYVTRQVPLTGLPSYVDDIIEGYYYNETFYEDAEHTIGIIPEEGKIYVDKETNYTYRWSGSMYVQVGGGEQQQADWNQQDDTQADFIKNRPFYEDVIEDETVETPIDIIPYGDIYDMLYPFAGDQLYKTSFTIVTDVPISLCELSYHNYSLSNISSYSDYTALEFYNLGTRNFFSFSANNKIDLYSVDESTFTPILMYEDVPYDPTYGGYGDPAFYEYLSGQSSTPPPIDSIYIFSYGTDNENVAVAIYNTDTSNLPNILHCNESESQAAFYYFYNSQQIMLPFDVADINEGCIISGSVGNNQYDSIPIQNFHIDNSDEWEFDIDLVLVGNVNLVMQDEGSDIYDMLQYLINSGENIHIYEDYDFCLCMATAQSTPPFNMYVGVYYTSAELYTKPSYTNITLDRLSTVNLKQLDSKFLSLDSSLYVNKDDKLDIKTVPLKQPDDTWYPFGIVQGGLSVGTSDGYGTHAPTLGVNLGVGLRYSQKPLTYMSYNTIDDMRQPARAPYLELTYGETDEYGNVAYGVNIEDLDIEPSFIYNYGEYAYPSIQLNGKEYIVSYEVNGELVKITDTLLVSNNVWNSKYGYYPTERLEEPIYYYNFRQLVVVDPNLPAEEGATLQVTTSFPKKVWDEYCDIELGPAGYANGNISGRGGVSIPYDDEWNPIGGVISDELGKLYVIPATSDTIGGIKVGSGLSIDSEGVLSAETITVDSAISSISENPVQNKVIEKYLEPVLGTPADPTAETVNFVTSTGNPPPIYDFDTAGYPNKMVLAYKRFGNNNLYVELGFKFNAGSQQDFNGLELSFGGAFAGSSNGYFPTLYIRATDSSSHTLNISGTIKAYNADGTAITSADAGAGLVKDFTYSGTVTNSSWATFISIATMVGGSITYNLYNNNGIRVMKYFPDLSSSIIPVVNYTYDTIVTEWGANFTWNGTPALNPWQQLNNRVSNLEIGQVIRTYLDTNTNELYITTDGSDPTPSSN